MKQRGKVFIIPTDNNDNCIVKFSHHMERPDGFMTTSYLNSISGRAHHMYVTINDPAVVGDYVMFYGCLSRVLEDNGDFLKIETYSTISLNDAELLNEMRAKAGEPLIKPGDPSTLRHSFSKANLPKVVATTDKSLGLDEAGKAGHDTDEFHPIYPQPNEDFVYQFCESGGIYDVELEVEPYGYCGGCRSAGLWHCAHADTCGANVTLHRPKTDSHGLVTIKPLKTSWSKEEIHAMVMEAIIKFAPDVKQSDANDFIENIFDPK